MSVAIALSLLLQTAAPVPGTASNDVPAAGAATRDIIVTARPLAETEREWKDCRKRNCPPDQEIAAALAHGENLFVAGDYRQARGVLGTTIASTRGAARQFPVQVGALRRAEANVGMHMGEDVLARRGMLASKQALAAGLGDDDPRVLAQRLQVADAIMLEPAKPWYIGDARPFITDKRRVTLRTYEAVARDAARLGYADLEGRALIRIAALQTSIAAGERGNEPEAEAAINRVLATTDPRQAVYREAAQVLRIKAAAARGDTGAVDTLVARYAGRPSATPVLLYAPPIDWRKSTDRRIALSLLNIAQNMGQEVDYGRRDQWIDIGFHVRPDGRVEDVEVLRHSAGDLTDWVVPAVDAVKGRRYAPLSGGADAPGTFRVERHTFTASNDFVTGSRVRMQNGIPRVVVTDMTIESRTAEAAAPAPKG